MPKQYTLAKQRTPACYLSNYLNLLAQQIPPPTTYLTFSVAVNRPCALHCTPTQSRDMLHIRMPWLVSKLNQRLSPNNHLSQLGVQRHVSILCSQMFCSRNVRSSVVSSVRRSKIFCHDHVPWVLKQSSTLFRDCRSISSGVLRSCPLWSACLARGRI
jgi:hypothetical protein